MPPADSVQQEPQTRHTPGPMEAWVQEHAGEGETGFANFDRKKPLSEQTWITILNFEEAEILVFAREQDAIRADLLAALMDLVDGMDDDPMFDAARAAIARATGGDS